MVARQIQLQNVKFSVLTHFGKFLPVVLVVSCHDRADNNFVGVIFLELFGTFNPISGSFFRDEFDVREGGFFSEGVSCALEDTGSHIDDLVFIKDECFCDCETPAHFKSSSDHGVGGGGWS